MIDLTPEMQEAINNGLAEGAPVLVGTASATGEPDMAFKGNVLAWSKDELAFWERSDGQTMRNMQENPQVCLIYRNPARGAAWKFFGRVQMLREGTVRDGIWERVVEPEKARDPERKGYAVLVRLDRVVQGRNVIMARD